MGTALVLFALLAAPDANLLRAAQSSADKKLTDGEVALDGDGWLAPSAVELRAGSSIVWDLGAPQPLGGAAIQADHNDVYVLSVSDDQRSWREVFRADAVPESGLRTRSGTFDARGRYVRLEPKGGDGRYSVTEVELFTDRTSMKRSTLLRLRLWSGNPLDVRWGLWLLAAVIGLCVVSASSPRWLLAAVSALIALALGFALYGTFSATALEPTRLNWIRFVVSVAALCTILRSLVFPNRAPARTSFTLDLLGMTAALGVLCFLNMGRPQFMDLGRNAPTFLHHYDMRTYFPIAKYFPELRFDGVYAASAEVVAEDKGFASVAPLKMRDLRNHEMVSIGDSQAYLKDIRARFSDARWAEFKKDMGYFRRAMGDGVFLGSMQDHGGNATPVWFLAARALFGQLPASDFVLWLGVIVDALLLAAAFASLYWAYGPRTMLVALTAFGAMDFYLFGTNWVGAALRHDWMALWCLGLSLLRREKYFWAGGLLAWAALIRAFPALAFVTMAAPVLFRLFKQLWRERRAFSLRSFVRQEAAFVRVCTGAAVIGGAFFLLSVRVFGWAAWPEWLHKVAMLNGVGHINNIALSLVAPNLFVLNLVATVLVALVLIAVRNARFDEAAALGSCLVGVVFSPANYYMQCLFMLAVLGREGQERLGRLGFVLLLSLCTGCYFTTFTRSDSRHFELESYLMLAAVSAFALFQLLRGFYPRKVTASPS